MSYDVKANRIIMVKELLLSVAWLSLPLLIEGLSILVVHPFYSGSHVNTINVISRAMVARGHMVTTIRFGKVKEHPLPRVGPSHRDIILHVNNTKGNIPFYEKKENATLRYLWAVWATIFFNY